MQLKLYYSVQNGGDGSAYPTFMESNELAEFDQDHMSEGWGESCTGSITLESETEIKCVSDVVTKESYFIDKYFNSYDDSGGDDREKKEFVAKFFPNGLPVFSVKTEKVKSDKYLSNFVFVDNRQVADVFREKKASGKVFEDLLNSQGS